MQSGGWNEHWVELRHEAPSTVLENHIVSGAENEEISS